jgi:CheY-like chemotaxis protein
MSHLLALVIEDYVDAAVIFREAVKRAGFEAEIIRDGKTALERLATVEPAIVILDLNMPGVSGAEILQQIRSDPRLAKTHVIVATAHPEMADEVRDQADLVLIKPVTFGQISALAARFQGLGE